MINGITDLSFGCVRRVRRSTVFSISDESIYSKRGDGSTDSLRVYRDALFYISVFKRNLRHLGVGRLILRDNRKPEYCLSLVNKRKNRNEINKIFNDHVLYNMRVNNFYKVIDYTSLFSNFILGNEVSKVIINNNDSTKHLGDKNSVFFMKYIKHLFDNKHDIKPLGFMRSYHSHGSLYCRSYSPDDVFIINKQYNVNSSHVMISKRKNLSILNDDLDLDIHKMFDIRDLQLKEKYSFVRKVNSIIKNYFVDRKYCVKTDFNTDNLNQKTLIVSDLIYRDLFISYDLGSLCFYLLYNISVSIDISDHKFSKGQHKIFDVEMIFKSDKHNSKFLYRVVSGNVEHIRDMFDVDLDYDMFWDEFKDYIQKESSNTKKTILNMNFS